MVGICCCEGWLIEVVVGLDDEGNIQRGSESVDETVVGSGDGDIVVGVLPVILNVC